MGNSITYELDDGDSNDEHSITVEEAELREHLDQAIGNMVGQIVGTLHNQSSNQELPVIRRKPDLSTFRHTVLYKEIKAMCGLPASSKRPNQRWSLLRGLQLRENGIAAQPAGSFTHNQQRRIATLFVPNQKDERLMSLESKVFICKHNQDGSKLITACQDSLIRIFDSSKGTYHLINRIKAKDVDWSILDVDFSPCGQHFAYSTWSDCFFMVPVDGNTEENFQWIDLNSQDPRMGIFSLRFSPCGRTLIGGCSNGSIYICDRETYALKRIKIHRNIEADMNAVSFVSDQDSNLIVSGCNNGVLRLWDLRCSGTSVGHALGGGNSNSRSSNSSNTASSASTSSSSGSGRNRNMPESMFMGHLDSITYIDSRNDGNYMLTNSKDQSIKIWDLRRPTPSTKINLFKLPLHSWDYRWDNVPREYYNPTNLLEGDVSVMTYRGHRVSKSLLRAKFSPKAQTGQRFIYTGCSTGRIIIYDVLTGQIKEAIEGHKDIVRDLSWHPTRSEIISSSWDSHVNLNVFRRNSLLKRRHSDRREGPLRRSVRIARRKGTVDEEEEEAGEDDDDNEHRFYW